MQDYCGPVLIQIDHNKYGSAKCSGLQFDNIIMAHGSLLTSLCYNDCNNMGDGESITKQLRLVLTELSKMQYFIYPENCVEGRVAFSFKVIKESEGLPEFSRPSPGGKSDVYSRYVENKVLLDETHRSKEARLCLMYKFEEVCSIMDEIINLEYIEDRHKSRNSFEYLDIPVFLFLMTGIPTKQSFEKSLYTLLTKLKGTPIYPGLSIAVESTPFANIAFYNSLSQGIISKNIGPNKEALLIDARLVFGCEGAPIYVFENGVKGGLVGIVIWLVASSNGEYTECTGFSVGLTLRYILKTVLELKINDYIPFSKLKLPDSPSVLDIERLSSAVIFVRCQHKWGSGVVVDADLGLVLTCSHIVHHAQDSVQVVLRGRTYPAFVVYVSPPSDLYDLALLSVGKVPGLVQLTMAEEPPVPGEPVITVGYALSSESSVIANGVPTLSSGCVSKVSNRGGPLQTTCCTQSGVSGGAVLRPPDQLIGIVVSNIRVGSSVLPFFSFAVSVEDFRAPVVQYINTRDPVCLQSLHVESPGVKMKWMLQNSKL